MTSQVRISTMFQIRLGVKVSLLKNFKHYYDPNKENLGLIIVRVD